MAAKQPPPEFPTPSHGAKYMIGRGFRVLALSPLQKTPAVKDWPGWSKTADEGTVSTCNHEFNWGIHPGLSGHFVLDVDRGAGKSGQESLDALTMLHGELPETFTVRTPSGGSHYYFKGKGENSAGRVGKHLDTRALNGYVVAPGSILNAKGIEVQYQIADASEPADAPQWLIDAMAKTDVPVKELLTDVPWDLQGNVLAAVEYLKTAPIATEGENGDINLLKIFAQLKDMAISRDAAHELVLKHYNDRCEPPWDMDNEDHAAHFNKKLEQGFKTKNPPGSATPEARLASAEVDFSAAPMPEGVSEEPAWVKGIHPFDPNETFPNDNYFLFIGAQGIAETGDLVAVQAKTKAGKSAVIGAMLSAMFSGEGAPGDFLGFSGHNRDGKAVLHFDTEQKPKDHHLLLRRALDRSALQIPPPWFHSYCIKSLSRKERVLAVERYLKSFGKTDGVEVIFIDGAADLCDDTNDKEASEKLGEKIVHWSQVYRCAVIVVLHENPSKDNEKMRGHLGTYFEMKAEAVLRVEKNTEGVSLVWGEKMRRGHIVKKDGPRFTWNVTLNRHVSMDSVRDTSDAEAAKLFGEQREELDAFMDKHLPGSASMPLKALNDIASVEGRSFATKSKPDKFVKSLEKVAPGKFLITQAPGERTVRFITRAAPSPVADGIEELLS